MESKRQGFDREDRLLRSMLLAYFLSGWTSLFGALLPHLRQVYGLSYEAAGMLLSSRSVGNLAAMLGSGLLVLYLGRRRGILLMTSWAVASYLVLSSGLGGVGLLAVVCLLEGASGGGIANFANTVISTLPGERATRGFNLLHGSYAVGAFLTPLALTLCTGLWPAEGWRVMTGFLCVLCLGQMAIYARMPLPPEPDEGGVRGADWSFLRSRRFWLGTLMIFFYLSVEYTIMVWLVTYFQDAGVLNQQLAQLMSSLLWLLMFAGRILGALLTGRVSRNTILLVDVLGLLVCYPWMISATAPWAVVTGLMGVGAFMATLYPTAFAFGSDCIKGSDLGCGAMNFIGAVGGTVTPALVGFVAERTGEIRSGMLLVAGGIVLLLGAILVSVFGMGKEEMEEESGL